MVLLIVIIVFDSQLQIYTLQKPEDNRFLVLHTTSL